VNGPALRRRALVLAALLACAFLGLIGRLTYLQVFRHTAYAAVVDRQNSKTITIRAKRGPILDRHGHILADSSAAESLFANPRQIAEADAVARWLAPILHEPAAAIQRRLESDRGFVWLRRRLPPSVAQAVRARRVPGLGLEPESIRLYPNRELAAHVIGFEGAEGAGLEGIERAFNAHLAGVPGKALVERDALGRDVSAAPAIRKPPRPGGGVSLTIDRTIQYLAEREIDLAYRRTGARAALAVVMDPHTGDLLALAIRPTFNPNSFAMATPNEWRNRAITDPFEPGSTFKVILAAAALEQRVVTPDEMIHGGNGVIRIANTMIRDWKKHGWLTFAEVLQNSSNVGAIKVGLALGRDRYARYISDFGFGAPTGVGLPGESRGLVRHPSRWSGLSLASLSIGQEISVTALQLVSAFSAVANGGRLMQPRLVRALLDPDGREIRTVEPHIVRQVIEPATARSLTRLLVRVVAAGTGHAAAIPGFDVAGKTGTAQKLDPATQRYSRSAGVLSFVGFAPADEPRFVMLVLLDEPRNERWGGEAAAPVFGAIGSEILRYLGAPPRDTLPVQLVDRSGGASLASSARGLSDATPTRPFSTTRWARDDGAAPAAEPIMPSLSGMTLRQALAALAPLRVQVEVQGQGLVVAQAPGEGALVEPDAVTRLELSPR
jgi:cell division protein FtsI (penicillin-binding protein 3)